MGNITFEGVSPTLFNFVSDLAGLAIRAIFAVGISHAFVYMMSTHLRRGNSIPAEALGQVPSDFVSSLQFARMLKFSSPVVVLAICLALGEFSHSIADLGLSFVAVDLEGPMEAILDLETRNPARLLELSGDPFSLRTYPFPDKAVQADATGDFEGVFLENFWIQTFLVAVDDVVGGGIAPGTLY